jgi:hypothetical protein
MSPEQAEFLSRLAAYGPKQPKEPADRDTAAP